MLTVTPLCFFIPIMTDSSTFIMRRTNWNLNPELMNTCSPALICVQGKAVDFELSKWTYNDTRLLNYKTEMFIFLRTAKCSFLIAYPLKKWLPILKRKMGGVESGKVPEGKGERNKKLFNLHFKWFYAEQNTAGPYWYLNDYQIILILFQRTFSSCRFVTLNEDFF